MASEAGIMSAAPSPASARPARRTGIAGATAQIKEAAENRAAPAMKTRLRPMRSASRPPVMSSAA